LRSIASAILVTVACAASAQEFRAINPIRAPRAPLPPLAERVVPQKPVPREKVEEAVATIAAAWNTPTLARHLSKNFYDRDRLLDNLASQSPRDARLRVCRHPGHAGARPIRRAQAGRRAHDGLAGLGHGAHAGRVQRRERIPAARRHNELIIEISELAR
jgi:hypothetical protein